MSFGEGNLHDEVDRLKVVNGKLCAEINRQERVIERMAERFAKLTVERNAYIEMVKRVQNDCDARDVLIRDMHRVMWACREAGCPHRKNGCFRVKGNGDGECWFEQRMHELGIETRKD